jgi:hypothetical protein
MLQTLFWAFGVLPALCLGFVAATLWHDGMSTVTNRKGRPFLTDPR